eukprot:3471715-Prymnesium_polylepis.1
MWPARAPAAPHSPPQPQSHSRPASARQSPARSRHGRRGSASSLGSPRKDPARVPPACQPLPHHLARGTGRAARRGGRCKSSAAAGHRARAGRQQGAARRGCVPRDAAPSGLDCVPRAPSRATGPATAPRPSSNGAGRPGHDAAARRAA